MFSFRSALIGLGVAAVLLAGWSVSRRGTEAGAKADPWGIDALQRAIARGLAPPAFVSTDGTAAEPADAAAAPDDDADPSPPVAADRTVHVANMLPFCGVGQVTFEGGPRLPLASQGEALAAVQAALTARAASPDELTRARALWLRGVARFGSAAPSSPPATAVPSRLPATAATAAPLASADTTQEASDRNALIGLATITRNPAVYGMAWRTCEPDCSALSASAWAQLDNDDALPWLHVAQEAEGRRDAVGRDAALLRAARASRHSDPAAWLLTSLDEPLWAGLAPAARWQVEQMFIAAFSATPAGPEMVVTRACVGNGNNGAGSGSGSTNTNASSNTSSNTASPPLPNASNELCGALAAAMIARHPGLQGQAIGLSLAERAGWSADRLGPLKEERDAVRALVAKRDAQAADFRCAALDAQRAQWIARGSLGELGMWREALRVSSVPPAQLAQQWRNQHALRP